MKWEGLSAIGTLLAVVVALFLPFITKMIEANNIKKLVLFDLYENYLIIEKAHFDYAFNPQKNISSEAKEQYMGFPPHLLLYNWDSYKGYLVILDSDLYALLNELFNLVTILKESNKYAISQKPNTEEITFVLEKASVEFLRLYNAKYKQIKKPITQFKIEKCFEKISDIYLKSMIDFFKKY